MTSDGFAGSRVDGPDPALFGLHCTLARGRTLVPLAKALGRAAVLPDMPGHGHRPWDRQGRYFEACQGILDAAPSGRVPVFGHSFGGVLALHFALAQPERVGALVLYEPVAFVYAHEAGDPEYPKFLERNAGFAEAMSQGDLSTATRQFLSFWSDGPPDELPASARQAIESQIDLVPAQEPMIFPSGAPEQLRLEDLARLNCPVLLLRGARCEPITTAIHRAMMAHLPDAQEHVFDDAGHMAPVSDPVQTAAVIAPFLARAGY